MLNKSESDLRCWVGEKRREKGTKTIRQRKEKTKRKEGTRGETNQSARVVQACAAAKSERKSDKCARHEVVDSFKLIHNYPWQKEMYWKTSTNSARQKVGGVETWKRAKTEKKKKTATWLVQFFFLAFLLGVVACDRRLPPDCMLLLWTCGVGAL